MKKFFKYLGFGVLSVVVFFVAIFAIASIGGVDTEDTFPPYIEETVPKLTTWNVEQYNLLMSQQAKESATSEQWQLYMDMYTKLGELKSIGLPELQNSEVEFNLVTGRTTYVVYLVPLSFDTGEAHVQLGLLHNDGSIEINSVRFFSDLLFK